MAAITFCDHVFLILLGNLQSPMIVLSVKILTEI